MTELMKLPGNHSFLQIPIGSTCSYLSNALNINNGFGQNSMFARSRAAARTVHTARHLRWDIGSMPPGQSFSTDRCWWVASTPHPPRTAPPPRAPLPPELTFIRLCHPPPPVPPGGKGSEGRAANGDRPKGAASCRREQRTMATCQAPLPPVQHCRVAGGRQHAHRKSALWCLLCLCLGGDRIISITTEPAAATESAAT